MKKNYTPFLILVSAFLFYFLFFGNSAGINVLLITAYTIGLFFLFLRNSPGKIFFLLMGGMVISSLAVVFAHTIFSMIIFSSCFILFTGNFAYQQTRHLQYGIGLSLISLVRIPSVIIHQFSFIKKKRTPRYASYLRFTVVPVFTIILLFILYSNANAMFLKSFERLFEQLGDFFSSDSFNRLLFFLLGVFLFSLCFVQIGSSCIVHFDAALNMNLVRRKRKSLLRTLNRLLLRKQQMAIVLFFFLNAMILWLNYLDVTHIWFGFEWDGGYLKEMVHEGTYLLIIAILISITVALYYLNSNILFIKNNRLFRLLVIAWLIQNALMVISVAIRNGYYIEYFALAYKRIFVYFFLAACFVGLVSIILMMWNKKSIGFLLSANSVSLNLLIVCSACFNWDAIIARYNFSNYQQSFVHYDFLIGLNDSALPYMNYSDEQLTEINKLQRKKFSFSRSPLYTDINFSEGMKTRKKAFGERWENHNWLEWNYPEYKAYQTLF